jgi:enamine deaminase RidA (YjgF/YER057c/UK114 family)
MGNVELLMPGRGYSSVAVVSGSVKTVYIGGQNAVDESGNIVGKGDFVQQVEQVFRNLETALAAGGAKLEHIIKWNIYAVEGTSAETGFAVFQRMWGSRPNLPLITVVFVSGLAHPDFLIELDAIAIVPD